MTQVVLALLGSFSAPLFLLPIEKILPFPCLIEELIKLIIVGIIIKAEKKIKNNFVVWIILAGMLFTLSESIFYLVNFFAKGNLLLFPQRIILTGILHIFTILTMYFLGRKNSYLLPLGYLIAVITHWFFNITIKSLY